MQPHAVDESQLSKYWIPAFAGMTLGLLNRPDKIKAAIQGIAA